MIQKEIYTIKTIDGIDIPITQIIGTYVETTDILGEVCFYASVLVGNDEAYRYFNPKAIRYRNYVNGLPGKRKEFLLKVVEYDYKNALRLSDEEIDKKIEGRNVFDIDEWSIRQATQSLLDFNTKIASKLPTIAKTIELK